jgi:hypothetical protein
MKEETNTTSIEVFSLQTMEKGWFIGNFVPTLWATNDVEVAVKEYNAGDYEAAHYHKIATEFTVIVNGTVEMNGIPHHSGTIIKVPPHVVTDFRAITNVTTLVVKIPGANNDKYNNAIN